MYSDGSITTPTAFESPGASMSFFDKVKKGFEDLFLEYRILYGQVSPPAPSPQARGSTSNQIEDDCLMELLDEDDDYHRARKKLKGKGKKVQTELERYLSEDCEEDEKLDLLLWWKGASSHNRFPVLARMDRDRKSVV